MTAVEKLQQFVAVYQGGMHRDEADERVARWLGMFDADDRTPVAAELVHVLERSFLTREQASDGVIVWLENPERISGGLVETWEAATFLNVQTAGGSQRELYRLLDQHAMALGLPPASEYRGELAYVYVDDLSVHGMRVLNDLSPWIQCDAPDDFDLLLLLQRRLADQHDYITNELARRTRAAGKTVRVHWWCDQEFVGNDCYRPASIPSDEEVTAYLTENRIDPRLRRGGSTGRYFSSDLGRCLLETALLRAGVCVLAANDRLQPREYMRPLGNTIWPGLGVGVPIVTWRNCPNSAPLALWADGLVPPLFPRQAN